MITHISQWSMDNYRYFFKITKMDRGKYDHTHISVVNGQLQIFFKIMKMDRGKYDHTHISVVNGQLQRFLYQHLCFLFATVIKGTHVQH